MSKYAYPDVLVDTQWLLDHLDDPYVRVIEVDTSPEISKNTHIPGAVFWNIFTDLLTSDLRMNLDPQHLEKLLSKSGISPETIVIPYGSNPATGGWIFWLLKTLGHDRVYVLNGGQQKWLAENRPVTTELSSFPATKYQSKSVDVNLRVSSQEIQTCLEEKDGVFLDVRTPQEYSGEIFMMKPPKGNERGGHIPGAVNIENTLTMNEDGTFKSFSELQTLFSSQGVTPHQQIFPYCAIGARSASIWFVLKYLLGYSNVRNYDGSWNEWSRLPDVVIE
jgi:thiosulfate/3-mercaptopyruvate sulfurtransferase